MSELELDSRRFAEWREVRDAGEASRLTNDLRRVEHVAAARADGLW
jgi:hypothetical protein